jgi:uncharacterized protein (DUF433 family)
MEAARLRRFSGIAFRGGDAERRAWVIGTGLDVWEIIELRGDHESDEALLDAHPSVDARALRPAAAYYASYADEIESAIAADHMPSDELTAAYPAESRILITHTSRTSHLNYGVPGVRPASRRLHPRDAPPQRLRRPPETARGALRCHPNGRGLERPRGLGEPLAHHVTA